jgi:hypothetical protein
MRLPATFEMTTTRADFLRLLPAAVDQVAFVEEGNCFVHREQTSGGRDALREWRITLDPMPALRIGAVVLERHRAGFQFSGYTPEEVTAFMSRFELYFRRGGG